MKRYLTLSLAVFLPVLIMGCTEIAPTAAEDASSESVRLGKGVVHHVSVGGADLCTAVGLAPGCDKNFSLAANMREDGTVNGQWQDGFAGGGQGIHAALDCLNISGNTAIVGGVITKGTALGANVSGQRAITAVIDNGTSANDPADQISFTWFGPGLTTFLGSTDCNALSIANFNSTPFQSLFNLGPGQVTVR